MNYKGHIIKERYKNETKAHTSNQVLIEKMKEENWTVASQIARNDEMFIFIEDPEGRLPIHYVVNLGGPISLMDIILTCYPVCISIRDPNGDLPIHLATRHNHESLTIKIKDLITYLVDKFPEGLTGFLKCLQIHITHFPKFTISLS